MSQGYSAYLAYAGLRVRSPAFQKNKGGLGVQNQKPGLPHMSVVNGQKLENRFFFLLAVISLQVLGLPICKMGG